MTSMLPKTGERIIPENITNQEEYIIYLEHMFAYQYALNEIEPNHNVIEVGCGEGYGTSMLSQKADIVGLDIDKESIEYAQKKYGSNKCRYRHYDGNKIPYDDNSFDIAISFQVVEHVVDDASYIKEIYRVLKSGGTLILVTPNKTHREKVGEKPYNRFHLREYNVDELKNLIGKYFQISKFACVCANQKIWNIELNRIKDNWRILSLDPLNLRALLPETTKPAIIKFFRKLLKKSSNEADGDYRNKFKLEDFCINESNSERCLDLLCLARKK